MIQYFKKHPRLTITLLSVILLLFALLCLQIGKYCLAQREKPYLVQQCNNYFEFLKVEIPIEFINDSNEAKEKYKNEYLANKKVVYDMIFSKEVEEYVKAYETCATLVDYAVQSISMCTYINYEIVDILKVDVGSHSAKISFLVNWTYREIDLTNKADMDPIENSGHTYYKLSFIREDNKWKIVEVNWNPFTPVL